MISSRIKIVSDDARQRTHRCLFVLPLDALLLFKSRFLAACILVLVGFVLFLIVVLSWFLARNNKQQLQQRHKLKKTPPLPPPPPPTVEPVAKPASVPPKDINGVIPPPPTVSQTAKPPSPPPPATAIRMAHSPTIAKRSVTPPMMRARTTQGTFTRESSTGTEDDDDAVNTYLRHYQTLPPVPSHIDEEYEERFSLKMNKSEELGLGYLTNGYDSNAPLLSHEYDNFCPPVDNRTGLIKPLNMPPDQPKRYTRYVSSCSRFVLPRPVKSSAEYQQR
jgi:hypothetical protein